MPPLVERASASLRLLAALAAVVSVVAASSCGECVFDEELVGTVVDGDGAPIPDAQITSCRGTRCDPGGGEGCSSATSASDGTFTLRVPQCRPAPFECELAPVTITRAGCESLTVQPARQTPSQTFTLRCS